MRHASILVAVLTITPLTNATAQLSIRPGAKVRVAGLFCQPSHSNCVGGRPEHRGRTFVAWKSALVVHSIGDTHAVPVDFETRFDVRWGRKTNTGNAGIGFLLGGVLGGVIGYASYEECVPQGGFSCIGPDFGREVGGLAGLMIGAIIGGSPEVRFDRLRVSLGLQPDGWFGLGASVRF